MRSTTFFHATTNTLVAAFFILIGLLALVLPWIAWMRRTVVDAFVGNPLTMTVLGLGLLTVGALLLVSIWSNRREYYHLKTGNQAVMVSEELLDGYVNEYWGLHFPDQEFVSTVSIKNNKIHIVADLPPLPFEDQRPFLKRVEEELAMLFAEKIGYHHSFSISVSFHDSDSDSILSMN